MKTDAAGRLEKCVPPGTGREKTMKQLMLPPAALAFWSINAFMVRLLSAIENLYVHTGTSQKVFRWDADMRDFTELVSGGLWVFWAALAFSMILLVSNYRSFTRETKSIYVMKRLKDAGELRRRVVTVPLLIVLICAVLSVILMGLQYAAYLLITPEKFICRLDFAQFIDAFRRALL